MDKKLKFIFITPFIEEDFFKSVKHGMEDACHSMGVESVFTGVVDVNHEEQADLVRKAVKEGYDGIAISVAHPTVMNGVIADAIKAGIPVVGFNIDSTDPGKSRLSCICQDLYGAGVKLGKEMDKYIEDNSTVLITLHSEGCSALDDRSRGIKDSLKHKKIIWQTLITSTDPHKACSIILDYFKENKDINTVLCTGQADTEGAGLAVKSGILAIKPEIAGFDLSPDILKFIKDGIIRFTIDQQPYAQGFYPVVQLALYCRYGIKPCDMDAGATIIDKTNVNLYEREN